MYSSDKSILNKWCKKRKNIFAYLFSIHNIISSLIIGQRKRLYAEKEENMRTWTKPIETADLGEKKLHKEIN